MESQLRAQSWRTGRHLVIRADASATMGTGHLMRCLAVAQEWRARGGTVTLVTVCAMDALLDRFAVEGVEIIRLGKTYPDDADWAIMRRVLHEYADAWVILDGYHFDARYQQDVLSTRHRLAVVDDNAHLPEYFANVILNQNIHASELADRYGPSPVLLLGPRYALLRREFSGHDPAARDHPGVASRVLVSFGGSDPGNVTQKVLAALADVKVPGLEVVVLLGAANARAEAVRAAVHRARFSVHVERDSRNVAEWMAWAHIAVAAAGSTTWELAYMGVPSILITVAENQRYLARRASAAGIAQWAGEGHELTPEDLAQAIRTLCEDQTRRIEMSRRSRDLIDGRGAARFLDVLSERTSEKRKAVLGHLGCRSPRKAADGLT